MRKPPLSIGSTGAITLFRLKVSVFFVRIEAGTITVVTEIAMTYDQGAGVTLVQVFKQVPHRRLLLSRTRIVGLTAGIISPFIADTNRMGIVMMPFY